MLLRAGDDDAAWPPAQIALDGAEVPVDEVAHDYEAPEWKAVQILDGGMGGGAEARDSAGSKDGLRLPCRPGLRPAPDAMWALPSSRDAGSPLELWREGFERRAGRQAWSSTNIGGSAAPR